MKGSHEQAGCELTELTLRSDCMHICTKLSRLATSDCLFAKVDVCHARMENAPKIMAKIRAKI
jgi:hypothetical protein